MENLIEELTKVNPSNLSEEGLKLFNKINEIIDRNEELEERNKDLQESVDQIYDDYQDIGKMYFNLIEKIENNIEELKQQEKEELKGMKGQDRYFVKQIYQYKIQVLEELLTPLKNV